jgi:nucleotide-binding universal stress UspA family protein
MERILVAVDFTESSLNSLEHAITIASRAKSDIIMVWVDRMGSVQNLLKEEDMANQAEEKLKDLQARYRWKLIGNKIEYKIRYGRVYAEIIKEAEESKADLLFTGTHGSSGYEPFMIGGNAFKMVVASPCPVITIRQGTDITRDLKRIVVPIDNTLETRQKIPMTSTIASIFGAEVHILSVYTNGVKTLQQLVDSYADQVAKHLHGDRVHYVRHTVRNSNLAKATLEYAAKVDANLISVMTEQEKATSNLWMGSYASQIVNQSPIPVLSVHPVETMRIFNI